MKVVCDSCQAKYQIPDERVLGRKIKIRCRKCANAIIVRGDLLASEPPPAAPVPAGVEWHVSVDGEPHGPYPHEQMIEMLSAGQVTWDMHVWRDGYSSWRLASEDEALVDALQSAAAAAPGEAEDDGPTRVQQAEDALPGHAAEGFPGADRLQPVVRQAFAERAAQRTAYAAGHAGAASAPSAAGFAHAGGEPLPSSPRVDANAMTGERHEDSVLFSTQNLVSTPQAPRAQAPARDGYANGEGSGLIDIRALAALTSQGLRGAPHAGNGYAPAAQAARGNGRADDFMDVAQQTGAFATIDSIAPVDRPARRSNALPIAIVVGAAIIAVAGFAAAVVIFKPPAAPAAGVTIAGEALPAAAAAAEPNAPDPEAAEVLEAEALDEPPAEGEPAAADEVQAQDAEHDVAEQEEASAKAAPAAERRTATATPSRRARRNKARARPRRKAAPEPEAKASAKAAAADDDPLEALITGKSESKAKASEPEAPASAAAASDLALLGGTAPAADAKADKKRSPARDRSIDELLDTAVDKKGGGAAAADLPATPARADVLKAMRGVESKVRACAEGKEVKGTAAVALTVAGPTGRISGVRVTGIQGDVGSCIARAVRDATFPKFSKTDFKIQYPYTFR